MLLAASATLEGAPATVVDGRLMVDGQPFRVQGVNYYPKDDGWRRFWLQYPCQTGAPCPAIERELDRLVALGGNAVRIFLPYLTFSPGHPQLAQAREKLRDFVDVRLRDRGLKVVVTLFDYYASVPDAYPAGGDEASRGHVREVVSVLGANSSTVLAYDIKNEPDRDYAAFGRARVVSWMRAMIAELRLRESETQAGNGHLITIGFYGATTTSGPYAPDIPAELAADVDFVSMHYFLPEATFESDLAALLAAISKPVLLEEFGLHTYRGGDDPHTERQQAAYYNAIVSTATANGLLGILAWTLNDFSYVEGGLAVETHRCQGVVRNRNVTTCDHSGPDYSPKPAADILSWHFRSGYLDTFDGWVTSSTASPSPRPPAGWSQDIGAQLCPHYDGPLCSPVIGEVALAKIGTPTTGAVTGPLLRGVDIDRYPFLAGVVTSYRAGNLAGNEARHSRLHLEVLGPAAVRLLTVEPTTAFPFEFRIDLRALGWRGVHDFRVRLVLDAVSPSDGYASVYQLDWLGVQRPLASVPVYRAYNLTASYHFFTTSRHEFDNAVAHGYRDESATVPFRVRDGHGLDLMALFRLYNPNSGQHYYTASAGERDVLMGVGWVYEKDEGFVYASQRGGTVEVFKLYNSNSGVHLYTVRPEEKDAILQQFPGIWFQHTSVGYVFTSP